jgi:hypothetical protein
MTNSLLDALAKPPPPPSELDELISRDPLDLSAQDIDKIISFQRAARARREAGGRTKKEYASQPGQSLDLAKLGLVKADTKTITPPTDGSFRRRL